MSRACHRHLNSQLLTHGRVRAGVQRLALSCVVIAASTSASAQPAAESDIPAIVDGQAVRDEMQRQQARNSSIVNNFNWGDFAKPKASSPQLNQLGSELTQLRHNVVSPEGEKVIWLIRSAASPIAATRSAALAALQEYSQSGVPEALTFTGFVLEYGLFGNRKDPARAQALYAAAAAKRYQPAVYDLGIDAAYGRGRTTDFGAAVQQLASAAAIAPDTSSRVCGMGSFVAFRNGAQARAQDFARGCVSPLASLALLQSRTTGLHGAELEDLRRSVGTGVDDGLALIQRATRPLAATDNQYLFCKYMLVTRFRRERVSVALRDSAKSCYEATTGNANIAAAAHVDQFAHDQAILAISSFVPTEITALDALRKSNHYHYDWSVPYLPFTQQDAILFEPLMGR
jgi:TPR repeat protein